MTDVDLDEAGLRPGGTVLPLGEAEPSLVANVYRSGPCIVNCLGGTVSVGFSLACCAKSLSSSASAPPCETLLLGDRTEPLLVVEVRAFLARSWGSPPGRPRVSCDCPPNVAVDARDWPESEAGARVACWAWGSDGTSPTPPMEWDPSPSDLVDRRSIVMLANRRAISLHVWPRIYGGSPSYG